MAGFSVPFSTPCQSGRLVKLKHMKHIRPLFGLKFRRFIEWTRDIKAEKPGVDEFYHMGLLALKAMLRPISSKAYRHRLTTCYRCPVFNRKLKSCRNGENGCGCYTPYKALGPVDCWLREQTEPVRIEGRWLGTLDGWGKEDPRYETRRV